MKFQLVSLIALLNVMKTNSFFFLNNLMLKFSGTVVQNQLFPGKD